MDYEAEQAMEMEALESILMDDLEEFDGTTPAGWGGAKQIYKVHIRPAEADADVDDDMQPALELLFAHTPSYPDEAPLFKVRSERGLSDAEVAVVQALLQQEAEANLGMAMVYTLVSAAQEWLQNKATAPEAAEEDSEAARKRAEAEEEARRAAARAHGHMVTVELFMEWKRKFDAEQALARAALKEDGKDERAGRMSGKQWFLQGDGLLIEKGAEAGALSEDEEEDLDTEEGGAAADGEDEEEDEDFEEDDEEEEEMLAQYLASKS